MKKQIVAIVVGMFLISLVSALYGGECLSVELDNLNDVVYIVVGNESSLEGLTINLNGTLAEICTTTNYKPDNFTIVFFDKQTETIIKEVQVGGGGSSKTIYKDRNITEYADVDNYLDREVIKEVGVEKDCPGTKTVRSFSLFPWFLFALSFACVIVLIIRMKNYKEETENES